MSGTPRKTTLSSVARRVASADFCQVARSAGGDNRAVCDSTNAQTSSWVCWGTSKGRSSHGLIRSASVAFASPGAAGESLATAEEPPPGTAVKRKTRIRERMIANQKQFGIMILVLIRVLRIVAVLRSGTPVWRIVAGEDVTPPPNRRTELPGFAPTSSYGICHGLTQPSPIKLQEIACHGPHFRRNLCVRAASSTGPDDRFHSVALLARFASS